MVFGQRNVFIKVIIWSVAILFAVTMFVGFSGYLSSKKQKTAQEEVQKRQMEKLAEKYNIREEDKNKVLAKFGEDDITVNEFFDFFGKIGMDIQSNYKTVEQRETILEFLIEREIIKNYSLVNQITVTDEDRLQVLMKNQSYKQYGFEKLKEMLEKNYFDKNQIDTAVYEEKVKKLVSDYSGKLDNESLKKYYEEHKYRYQNAKEYRISHLYVKNSNKERENEINEKLKKDPGILERYFNNNISQYLDSPQIRTRGLFLAFDKVDEVNVSNEQAQEYYNNNKAEFIEEEQVKASHILVGLQDKSKAKDIMKKIINGEDFSELAKKHSTDPGSASRGGDLGWFAKGRMVPEFEKKAFSMKLGEISEPVESKYGYHIIKLEDKKDRKEKSFKEVVSQIKKNLSDEKRWEILRIKSETIMNEYEEREAFENLVAKYSDGKTKLNNGDYDWLKKDMNMPVNSKDVEIYSNGKLSHQVWSTIVDLNIAEVSLPVKLDNGYIILKKLSEKQAEAKPYNIVKDEVRQNYMELEKERYARSAAEEALKDINENMSFEDAVAKYSDGKTKENKGLLPWFPLGNLNTEDKELVSVLDGEIAGMTFYFDNGSFRQGTVVNKDIETEIKKLGKGEISNIINNSEGFSIVRLEDIREGSIKSFDKVKDEIKNDLNMFVSDNDVKNYYEKNKNSLYTEPEAIKAAIILVNDENKAKDIYKKIQAGEEFGKLAKQYSEDYTKDNEGVIEEYIKRGDKDEAFENTAFNLKLNEVSEPVLTEYGYQIIKLLSRRAKKVFALNDKKDEIIEELLTPKRNEIYTKWLQEQKNKLGIEKNYSNFNLLTKYFN
ncbi:MAG: peptidylprolyl isomerase [Candidatus Muirbacterium halophilum]|nr:peptidylprolyl isomerase [Candidatus Muirbacterium halophilum]MCK9475998.1 peptidylprolyl isomerase [Candidatus Muirbacterium halophilum]